MALRDELLYSNERCSICYINACGKTNGFIQTKQKLKTQLICFLYLEDENEKKRRKEKKRKKKRTLCFQF